MGIIYVIFIELCTKCQHLPALKGNNSYKMLNFRIMLEIYKWSVVQVTKEVNFARCLQCREGNYALTKQIYQPSLSSLTSCIYIKIMYHSMKFTIFNIPISINYIIPMLFTYMLHKRMWTQVNIKGSLSIYQVKNQKVRNSGCFF